MNRSLIAAHRGAAAGNIHCNTWIAYEAALAQGADIMEIDVSRSQDGQLFVFHPGQEPNHLGSARLIADMTADDVRRLRYLNVDNCPTQVGVSTLDEVLEQLKSRCRINIDKFPLFMEDIVRTVRRHDMTDQVIVKTNADPRLFDRVEQIAPDLPYMVFARGTDDFSAGLKRRRLRYEGTEIIFPTEDCQVAQRSYVEDMHRMGLKVWANAIVFDYRRVLAAGHNDDISVAGRPDDGWGFLMDLGVDMIQTDWPGMLRDYQALRAEKARGVRT